MRVFSFEKFTKDPFCSEYEKKCSTWAQEIDGKEVINGECQGYYVLNCWTEIIKERKEKV